MELNVIISLDKFKLIGCDFYGLKYCQHCIYNKLETCTPKTEFENKVFERVEKWKKPSPVKNAGNSTADYLMG